MTHNKRPIYNYGSVKLSVYDWLSGIPLPSHKEPFDCVEVHFKNSRKEFFRNPYKLPLQIGDVVATETTSGHDIGTVSLTGELVRIQMQKKKADPLSPTLPKVYRKANEHDIEIWKEYRSKEVFLQKRSRELAIALGLEMKISDVEFQGDGSKATFYYTAEGRVDFRQLIKDMAKEFGTRIEMRQIGYRQEAARLGGIGSSGREISCSTWLTDFKSVTTAAARYQQLSLNPQKLAGQCGKLKCDLNFELDCYLEALRDFPKTDTKLQTEKGIATCQKVDIFKRLMWFTYEGDFLNWYKLTVDQVKEILQLTREKKIIPSIEEYLQAQEVPSIPSRNIDSESQEGSLTRFDEKPRSRNRKNQKTKNASQNKENNSKPKENTPKEAIEKRKNTPQKSKESNNTIPKEAPKEKEEAKNLVQGQTKRNSNKRRNKKTANPRPTPAQNNE